MLKVIVLVLVFVQLIVLGIARRVVLGFACLVDCLVVHLIVFGLTKPWDLIVCLIALGFIKQLFLVGGLITFGLSFSLASKYKRPKM